MSNHTLAECKGIAVTIGMTEEQAEDFFYHYDAAGWIDGLNRPVVRLHSAMMKWKRNQYRRKSTESKKVRLYPIKGKRCYARGCVMPAVYGPVGAYDKYYCIEHMPKEVKEVYDA